MNSTVVREIESERQPKRSRIVSFSKDDMVEITEAQYCGPSLSLVRNARLAERTECIIDSTVLLAQRYYATVNVSLLHCIIEKCSMTSFLK